jgi:hypothetical protein
MKNNYEIFEIDFKNLEIEQNIYYESSKKKSIQKAVGIYTNDLKLNLLKKHPVFQNEYIYKYLFVKSEKYEKINKIYQDKGAENALKKLYNNNCDIFPMDNLNIYDAVNKFMMESKSETILIQGLGDNCLNYLNAPNPNLILSDLIVMAFVKDGDYIQSELSRPFEIWQNLEQNFIKLYQSKPVMGKDGSSWFFVVFKKRWLIEKNREVLDLKEESPLFDNKIFSNRF